MASCDATLKGSLMRIAIAWVLCLVTADLSSADEGPGQIPFSRDAQADQAWTRHGFTEIQRDRIHSALQRGVEQHFIPGGALLIVHRGEPVFREATGYASLESRTAFPVDAPCRIASLTKPHTSTLLAMLVEQATSPGTTS
jgi:CubicO group peptidase (beta-lactamase class C family)